MNEKSENSEFTIANGTDLAFALFVLIYYFAAFSKVPQTSLFLIMVLIFLGVAYLTNGIYGFAYADHSGKPIYKIIYFVLQLIIGGLIIHFSKGSGFTAYILMPLVAHTTMTLDQDWIFAVNGSILFVFVISILSYANDWGVVWNSLPIFFAGQVFILIFTQTAVTEQKGRIKMEKLASELSEANQHLSEYAVQVKDLTISQERNRIAREIHDGLGHYLTTINMQIKATKAVMKKDPEQALHLLSTAEQLSSEALLDVRNSVESLREGNDGALSLIDRIEQLVNSSKIVDREIVFSVIGKPRQISPQTDITFFRVVQEAINNANKHSKATKVNIFLDFTNKEKLLLKIEDNGVGSESMDRGFGLIGMQERVKLVQGNIEFLTSKGKGFVIIVNAPG